MKRRKRVAFFDYPDVFEDFYPHYGVDQDSFSKTWCDTGNHKIVKALQSLTFDISWHEFSIQPTAAPCKHTVCGHTVFFHSSSSFHRVLWKFFYLSKWSWRWQRAYPLFAVFASYSSVLSISFIRQIRDSRPDIMLIQDYANGKFDVLVVLARILRIPVVAYHSGSLPDRYVGRLAKRWSIPLLSHIIVSSDSEGRMIAEKFSVPKRKISTVLTPIDCLTYRPCLKDEACAEEGFDPSRRFLLYVGRLDDRIKRVSAIIQSFLSLTREHVDTDLIVMGDGLDRKKLEELIPSDSSTRVKFLGWVSDEKRKCNLYNLSESLVIVSRSEGFPTVVGEALACGTPVLGTAVGGIPELVLEGETGWLIPADDIGSLETRLRAILADPSLVARMRAKARQVALDNVDSGQVARRFATCIDRTVCGQGRV